MRSPPSKLFLAALERGFQMPVNLSQELRNLRKTSHQTKPIMALKDKQNTNLASIIALKLWKRVATTVVEEISTSNMS
jgi:hypothetical protein